MLFCVCWCRFNEPTSVKHIKMDLLPLVANDANTAEIVAELAEYVPYVCVFGAGFMACLSILFVD